MLGTTKVLRLCLILIFTVSFCAPAWAFEDPLEYPAILTPLAAKTLLLDIARSGNRLIAVGQRGHIILSDDNGKSWQQAQVPVQETLTSVFFLAGGQTGWVTGHSGLILVSHDAGQTWSKQLDGYQVNRLAVDAYQQSVELKTAELDTATEPERIKLQTELDDLRLALDDAKAFSEEGPTRPFLDILFLNKDDGLAVGPFGLLVQTEDGGEHWNCISPVINNPEGLHYNALALVGDVIFLAGERGFARRSFDRGSSWQPLETPYPGSFFAVGGKLHDVILLGLRGNAVVSHDSGDTWKGVESGAKSNLSSLQMLSDGRFLVSQYSPNLLLSDADLSRLIPLSWSAGIAISSFAFAPDGSLVTVGVGGVNRIVTPDFSTKAD